MSKNKRYANSFFLDNKVEKYKSIEKYGENSKSWHEQKIFFQEPKMPRYKKIVIKMKNSFPGTNIEEIVIEKHVQKKKDSCCKALLRFFYKDLAEYISDNR